MKKDNLVSIRFKNTPDNNFKIKLGGNVVASCNTGCARKKPTVHTYTCFWIVGFMFNIVLDCHIKGKYGNTWYGLIQVGIQ